MKRYCIIGNPVKHSKSPQIYDYIFNQLNLKAKYDSHCIITNSLFENFIYNTKNYMGYNITAPYKGLAYSFIDEVHSSARLVNAVNCIKIINNKLIGYNTDIIGFEYSFLPILKKRRNILVLGNGGASKAIQFVLKRHKLNYQVISRKLKLNYSKITKRLIKENLVIINTTCLGMYPNTTTLPELPYEELSPKHLLFDLVYNPTETLFLKYGKKQKTEIKNGYEMLKIQAEESWKIWNPHI